VDLFNIAVQTALERAIGCVTHTTISAEDVLV